jgi:hypothetical protein
LYYTIISVNGVQKSEEMPTALIKNTRELRSDTMTAIIFKQFGSSKNLGFRKFTKKKIKHLSEVITQSVCAQVPLFQVYKKPNWGPSNGESYIYM